MSLRLNAAEVESLEAKILGSSRRIPPTPTPDEENAFRACRELVDGRSPRLITDDELDRMRRAAESYERRTGRPLLYRYEIMVAAVVDSLGRDYDEENARCLLASTKSRRAVITRRFEELGRQAVRIGGISESQHGLDLLHLESQSKGKPWLRADGTSTPPITREDIESSMKDLANRRENHRRFYGTILEFAAIP